MPGALYTIVFVMRGKCIRRDKKTHIQSTLLLGQDKDAVVHMEDKSHVASLDSGPVFGPVLSFLIRDNLITLRLIPIIQIRAFFSSRAQPNVRNVNASVINTYTQNCGTTTNCDF